MIDEKTTDDLRGALAVTLGFYAFTLLVFLISGLLRGSADFHDALAIGVPMMLVDGALAFTLWFPLRWTEGLRPGPRWLLVGGGVILIALIQSAWDTQLRLWIDAFSAPGRSPWDGYVRAATLNTWNTGMYVALLAFQMVVAKLREKERLLIAAQASERDAHMLALRLQLNPHFLFNTLNALSSLVVLGRTADAEAMLDRLSTFLRASLSADPKQLVSVAEEFDMLDAYLQIEAIRFGDRLVPVLDLPDALAGARMPPFLLQPLVENAIKYAVAPSRRPVEVRINATAAHGQLHLTVTDTGTAPAEPAPPGTGVGLANIRERLRLSYGPAATLDTHQRTDGFRVTLALPLAEARLRDRSATRPEQAQTSTGSA